MITRAGIVALAVVLAGVWAGRSARPEAAVERPGLENLPLRLQDWRGVDAAPFPDDVVAQLGVDDYVHRIYHRDQEHAGSSIANARVPVSVYVGYYHSQRQGDTIHSPQNCLPGAGWRPVESRVAALPVQASTVRVNEYVIAKGLDRQVVLYWYQGRGRVVASEYANKALLMLDAARLGRTNGGLVRLIAPVVTSAEATRGDLTTFASKLLPVLGEYLP